ncbi:MAG TPA: stealth family protein [Propionibacteriaceae bacterium]
MVKVTPRPFGRHLRRVAHGDALPQHLLRQVRAQISGRRAAKKRRALPTAEQDRFVPIDVLGHPALARVTEEFHAGEVIAQNLALVADVLDAHAITYFVLSAEPQHRRILVISENLREQVVAALLADLGTTGTYIAPVRHQSVRKPHGLRRIRTVNARTVLVFQYRATPDGHRLSGGELGCELQFWRVADARTPYNSSGEPLEPGTLMGTRSIAPLPDLVPPGALSLVRAPIDGTPRPQLPALLHTPIFQITQPIDVVYTWVDGRDPAWKQRKSAALAQVPEHELHALAANESRFESRDELRYSLRSLDMYADWVRQIFLVTDDQVPEWLDLSNPRITVVDHRDIFADRGRLPTFNSHAIESQLHHIDDLAENYLYLNDDVFFGRVVSPDDFMLANGMSKFFPSVVKIAPGPVRPSDLPVTSAAKNNRDLLTGKFGVRVDNKFRHMAHSLRRSVMYDLERDFGDQIAETASAQFRSQRDLSTSAALGHYYGFLTGRAVQGGLSYRYLDIGAATTPERLASLLRRRNVDIFCLNDHDSSEVDSEQQARMVAEFLEKYYPLPSQFERR